MLVTSSDFDSLIAFRLRLRDSDRWIVDRWVKLLRPLLNSPPGPPAPSHSTTSSTSAPVPVYIPPPGTPVSRSSGNLSTGPVLACPPGACPAPCPNLLAASTPFPAVLSSPGLNSSPGLLVPVHLPCNGPPNLVCPPAPLPASSPNSLAASALLYTGPGSAGLSQLSPTSAPSISIDSFLHQL
jgi:hypothetical protein